MFYSPFLRVVMKYCKFPDKLNKDKFLKALSMPPFLATDFCWLVCKQVNKPESSNQVERKRLPFLSANKITWNKDYNSECKQFDYFKNML